MINLFNNSTVRRADRLLDEASAEQLLLNGEFGILSMVEQREHGAGAYGVPINFVWDGNGCIYFHCAPDGHKLRCVDANPQVAFCIVGRTGVVAHKFTTAYESVIIRGRLTRGLSSTERMNALVLLLHKYSPAHVELGQQYTEKSFHRTEVLRLDIESVTGKAKRVAAQ